MNTSSRRRQINSISHSRWAAYAAAGAASALTCASSAEAEVHYSGKVHHVFRADEDATFPLDGSVGLFLAHLDLGNGTFGAAFAQIEGGIGGYYGGGGIVARSNYVSNLSRGANLSVLHFVANCDASSSGTACYFESIAFGSDGNFTQPGGGLIGFKFDRGEGTQYGWARIKTTGAPRNYFILEDYAWADLGESLLTGQRHSAAKAKPVADAKAKPVPNSGSLGLLALGGAGLAVWRKSRSPRKASLP